jgi:pyrroline-5-carboxylate reductase
VTDGVSEADILLVGGGRMGSALLAGWSRRRGGRVVVVDPAASLAGATVVPTLEDMPADFAPDVIVLAVKPQVAGSILPGYARFPGALFISIMAGRSLAWMGTQLGTGAIVRAMPNTPAAIGQGFTVACAGAGVSAAQRDLADALLAATGEVAWIAAEALLDPVTAISGGGPAYVFLLTELMAREAVAQGLPESLAKRLARQTVIGAAGLLAASDEEPAALRVAVTSPGGTTAEALAVLQHDDAWPKSFAAAIEAATRRSRALSG